MATEQIRVCALYRKALADLPDAVVDNCDDCGAKVVLRSVGPQRGEIKIVCHDCGWPQIVDGARDGSGVILAVGPDADIIGPHVQALALMEAGKKESKH